MNTNSIYTEIINTIRSLPEEVLPGIASLMRSIRDSLQKPQGTVSNSPAAELTGIWEDERPAEEIIGDIYSARSGYNNRDIDL